VKQSDTPSGVAVKVQWYAPSRAAFVHFRQRFEAEKVAKVCNGKELHGRVVSVKFQRPSLHQRTSFTAWMSNLAETVSKPNIVSFVQKYAKCTVLLMDQGDLPFSEHQGPAIVEKLLNRHGQLVSFHTSPCSSKELKRRALARFSDAKQAEEVVRYFKLTSSIEELGGNKLFVQRMFNLKYTLPGKILDLLCPPIEAVLAEMVGSVRYSIFDNGTTKSLSITGDNAAVIAFAKAKIAPILKSDTVRDPNTSRAIWTRYVASFQFAVDMEDRVGYDATGIWCDSRRQEIRVFGISDSQRRCLAQSIIAHCEAMATQVHAVPIPNESFEFILQNGRSVLDKLKRMSGCQNASLDLKHKSLLIEGTPLHAKKALGCLSRIADQESHPVDSSALCPFVSALPRKTILVPLYNCSANTCTVETASRLG
jgi:hypothetical protein